MKVKQDDVLTEQQLCKYIEKKFKKLYEKYGYLLNINSQNSYLCITLFVIMIFENFNRGVSNKIIRKNESKNRTRSYNRNYADKIKVYDF